MKILSPVPSTLAEDLKNVIEYRKSGLSVNHVVGCSLDCSYCVRHIFSNFEMKTPHLVIDSKEAVRQLTEHWAFRADITPIQIFNRATDPFLPTVKERLFETLTELDQKGLQNHVLVITRWKILKEDIELLEQLQNLKLTILVTWSGIADTRIEPVSSAIAERSIAMLSRHAVRTKKILYWRPLIAGVNDTAEHLNRARQLADHADATVFTGLFYRTEIQEYFHSIGIKDPYSATARRKILPKSVEERVLHHFKGAPIFRKTSCGVAFSHGLPDYNGHYGIHEICSICPHRQLNICKLAHRKPSLEQAKALARIASIDPTTVTIDDRRIEVSGSSEQERYFMQHSLNYQVHDSANPHFQNRHGRAEIGWQE